MNDAVSRIRLRTYILSTCILASVALTACSSGKSPQEEPANYDERAEQYLSEKPDEAYFAANPEAAEIGCCQIKIDDEHWQCSEDSWVGCQAYAQTDCAGGRCSSGEWGYLPRETSTACFNRCSMMSQVVAEREQAEETGLDVPQGSWAKFRFAQDLAAEGQCSEVDQVINLLDPDYIRLNSSSIELLRAQCALTGQGQLDAAEAIGREVYDGDDGGNEMAAAGLVSDAFKYRCDFDGAIVWAYNGDAARAEYLAPEVLINAAQLYDLQGRPELASRAARSFVDNYPFDYYEMAVSRPPESVSYNRQAASILHRENRVTAWRILAANNDNIEIPEADLAYMETLETPIDEIPPQFGDPFFNTQAADAFALFRAHEAIVRINGRGSLKLEEEEVESLADFAEAELEKLPHGEGPCELLAELLRDRLAKIHDSDGDGIPDELDECPEEAETYNGFEDSDGCPDIEASIAYLLERQIVINEKVQFRTDEAVLLPEGERVLDDVARILNEYEELRRIRIEGHTDQRASDAYNQDLSERRAQSVYEYLVSKGIDSERLATQGYGETRPLAFGNDAETWRLNRRVEFFVLESDPISFEGQEEETVEE